MYEMRGVKPAYLINLSATSALQSHHARLSFCSNWQVRDRWAMISRLNVTIPIRLLDDHWVRPEGYRRLHPDE